MKAFRPQAARAATGFPRQFSIQCTLLPGQSSEFVSAMKTTSGTSQFQSNSIVERARADPAATSKIDSRAYLSIRFMATGAAPPPSPPPKPLLVSRSEPRFEIKPGLDFRPLIEGKFDRPQYRPCYTRSAPPPAPPPPEPIPEPPEEAAKNPRWPPGEIFRAAGREPDEASTPDKPAGKLPPDPRDLPPPGGLAPKKPDELIRAQKPVAPGVDLPDVWMPLMPAIPQPHFLPPAMRSFFRDTSEPSLLRALQMLLSQGLDPAAKDEMGNSLLMLAVATGKPMVVRDLLERLPALVRHLLNRFGENAATLAQAYCPEVLPLLLAEGVEMHPENPVLQWYLSHLVEMRTDGGRLPELATLLAQGNYLNARDESGKTLLFHAVIRGDLEVVRFLCNLNVGPAVVWRDRAGKSLFGYTSEIADVELGAAICTELRELRRRDRPLYKRTVDRF